MSIVRIVESEATRCDSCHTFLHTVLTAHRESLRSQNGRLAGRRTRWPKGVGLEILSDPVRKE